MDTIGNMIDPELLRRCRLSSMGPNSLSAAARAVGVRASFLCDVEKGRKHLTGVTILRLGMLYDVDPRKFLAVLSPTVLTPVR